jgi:D-glycero-D-manno-heptose 1,7-bisphosphate phosphatase
MKAVFLDRDGTVTFGVPKYERVDSIDKVELLPNTLKALELLAPLDFKVFFVTNQAGLAEGLITEAGFNTINGKALELIAPSGIQVLKTYVCPHGEQDNCECRKPKPKLLLDAAKEYGIDLGQSYMIGDRHSDVMTGINAGTKTIFVKTGSISEDFDQATYNAPSLLEAIEYIARQEEA